MKIIHVKEPGGPEMMQMTEVPTPRPWSKQALVRIAAIGVNFIDVYFRTGLYKADLPIVPIYTNIFAPPLPQPKRYVQLGQAVRDIVESWPANLRVAIIGTGHLSLELGGPRQFGPHGPDPEFDRKAVEWIASGDIEKALGEVSLDSLWEPGNATHGFLDFMLMMGVAGAGVQADYVDTLDLFHTMEAYFTWYPKGGNA